MDIFFKRPELSQNLSVDKSGKLCFHEPRRSYWLAIIYKQKPKDIFKLGVASLIILANIGTYFILQHILFDLCRYADMNYWLAYQIITITMLSISFCLFLIAIVVFNILESKWEAHNVLYENYQS
ncbi:MAG: hypothetical protein MUE85_08030 [Microscillaceae bacterium]|jgi:hypothetical protein|nr:hypothetical protein [Microscillaceae bacterium]